jgi:uncharacterized protein YegP (UPF0339 family)
MKTIYRGLVVALILIGALGVAGPRVSDAQDKKGKALVFEVYKDKSGEFRFRLKDGEGNLLAISAKGYDKKAGCQTVIDAIKRDAAKAKVEDVAK